MKINKFLDFNMNNIVLEEDVHDFVVRCNYYEQFRGKKIVITGATGLIGSLLTKCLIELNANYQLGLDIFCVVRDIEKAQRMFTNGAAFICSLSDWNTIESRIMGGIIDYIIHTAAPTSSAFFTSNPVETFKSIVGLTQHALDKARDLHSSSIVYLSSLEAYGEILDDTKPLTEDEQGYVNPLNVRSCYPMGKRAAECLCYSYFKEYNTPVKIARLAQTFGAGVSIDDKRVFAYIAKSAIAGNDVVLSTTGESKKDYCYAIDAVDALLRILLNGKDGEAYNVANPSTYISVKDMAELVLDKFSPKNKVICECKDVDKYPPISKVRMSAEKLMSLGWKPSYNLEKMFSRLIQWYK